MCLFKTFSNSRKILWGGKTHGKSEDDTSEKPFKLKKKQTKQTCIKIACSTKTMIDQNVVIHQWLFFQNPRAWGTGFKWTKGEWSTREHGSITIGIAFMKTSSFFGGEGGGAGIHPKFCSDVILENQHQENQSFETVVIIDLRLIRLHWQIISLAFPAFCEKIDFPTFPAQFPKMAPFAASLVISAFPAWPETLL